MVDLCTHSVYNINIPKRQRKSDGDSGTDANQHRKWLSNGNPTQQDSIKPNGEGRKPLPYT